MADESLYLELMAFHATYEVELAPPTSAPNPLIPWENELFAFTPASRDSESGNFVKGIEARALFDDVFGNFQVEAPPKLEKQTSLHDLVSSGVERTIAGMDVDDLRKALASPPAPPAATAPSELQKRKQEFIAQTVEKRSDRLWDICAKATRKLESMGFNTERLNLDGLHRSMNSFVEDAVLAI